MADKPNLESAYALETPDDSRKLYAAWAATYDTQFADENHYILHEQVARHFALMGGFGPVLDVGAGTGLCGEALNARGIEPVDGTDISAQMLEVARTKGCYRTLFTGNILTGLDVTPGIYQGAVSAGTFTHGHVGPEGINTMLEAVRSGVGPQGYDPLVLFKCLLIGQWHGLSDPKLERALKVRLDFMIFCGLNLHARVPDETTHCRFRNALVRGGVYDDLLAEVCRQIEGHGLKLKEAEAAIIDATLVESAARPRTHIDAPEDRAEGEAPDDPQMHFSADPDARWVKKGSKSTLGYKAFARTDEEGFVDKVHTRSQNLRTKGDSAIRRRHGHTHCIS